MTKRYYLGAGAPNDPPVAGPWPWARLDLDMLRVTPLQDGTVVAMLVAILVNVKVVVWAKWRPVTVVVVVVVDESPARATLGEECLERGDSRLSISSYKFSNVLRVVRSASSDYFEIKAAIISA